MGGGQSTASGPAERRKSQETPVEMLDFRRQSWGCPAPMPSLHSRRCAGIGSLEQLSSREGKHQNTERIGASRRSNPRYALREKSEE
jgi:hypothetical protein